MGHPSQARRYRKPDDDTMISDSPGSIEARAQGASLIQVETLGRHGVFLLWFSALVSGIAIVGLAIAVIAFNRMSAHVNVLQYDLAQMKAQLEAQGLYEPTGH